MGYIHPKGLLMADNLEYLTGLVSGEMKVVRDMISDMRSDMKDNHKENITRMDAISDVTDSHEVRITSLETFNKDVIPIVDTYKRRLLVRAVVVAILGGAGTSPLWFTKVLPVFNAIFP